MAERSRKTAYWRLAEELKPSAEAGMFIPPKYLDLAKKYVQPKNDFYEEYVDEADATERLLNTAIEFQELYRKAKEQDIDLSKMRLYEGKILVGGLEFDINKKGDLQKILRRATKKKSTLTERMLKSNWSTAGEPLGAIIGLASGLFFLSSNLTENITGNVIGNISNLTSSIIGAVLFVGGLIAAFFWAKK